MAAVLGRGFNKLAHDHNNMTANLGRPSCYQNPFIAYWIVTFSTNAVAIVGGIISQFDLHRGQNRWHGFDRCDGWLFANGCFGVLHILAAIYIVRKIQEPEASSSLLPNHHQQQRAVPELRQPPEWSNDPHVFAEPVPSPTTKTTKQQQQQQPPPAKKSVFTLFGKKKQQQPNQNYNNNNSRNPPPYAPPRQEPIPQWVLNDMKQQQQQQRIVVDRNYAGNANTSTGTTMHTSYRIVKDGSTKPMGPPESWQRIKHVLCENVIVAGYIIVFGLYLAWQFFSHVTPCNGGMRFAMKCANLFLLAAPCAFVFSVLQLRMQRGYL